MPVKESINEAFGKVGSAIEALSKVASQLGSLQDVSQHSDNPLRPDGESIQHRVIHFKQNPCDQILEAHKQEFEQLKKRNEELQMRVKLLENGIDLDVTRRIGEAIDTEHTVKRLKEENEKLRQREENYMRSFKRTSRQYREAVQILTGYQIERVSENTFKLKNVHETNPDHKLVFEIDQSGKVELLKTDYCDELKSHIDTYLKGYDSYPAFLSAITLDLVKETALQTTMSEDMSLCTTIIPRQR